MDWIVDWLTGLDSRSDSARSLLNLNCKYYMTSTQLDMVTCSMLGGWITVKVRFILQQMELHYGLFLNPLADKRYILHGYVELE